MTGQLILRGIELRYALTVYMQVHGPASVPTLLDALDHWGFGVVGRPSKAVSDALRWEMGRGRVARIRRGRYKAVGWVPRGTEHRMHQRVLELREKARQLSLGAGRQPCPPEFSRPRTRDRIAIITAAAAAVAADAAAAAATAAAAVDAAAAAAAAAGDAAAAAAAGLAPP